jgi:hypothetical protein
MEKLEIAMRIRVLDPPADVTMMVQKGRDELLPAAKVNKKTLIFDLSLTVDISTGTPISSASLRRVREVPALFI